MLCLPVVVAIAAFAALLGPQAFEMANRDRIGNWAHLVTACSTSGTVVLSPAFLMTGYPGQISFNNKRLVIWGNNVTLDGGRQDGFFYRDGTSSSADSRNPSSLEIHDLIMQNTDCLNNFSPSRVSAPQILRYSCLEETVCREGCTDVQSPPLALHTWISPAVLS